jgi:hypothetical protein
MGNPTRARGFIGAIRRIFHFIFLTFKVHAALLDQKPFVFVVFITLSLTFFLYPILFSRRRNHFGMMVPPLASTLYPIPVIAHW